MVFHFLVMALSGLIKMNWEVFPSLLVFGRVCENLVFMFGRLHQWRYLMLCILLNYPYLIQCLPFWSISISQWQVKVHQWFFPLSPPFSALSSLTSTAINACEISNGGCSAKADCKRTIPGRRVCTCKAGYKGDGIVCLGTYHTSSIQGQWFKSQSPVIGSWCVDDVGPSFSFSGQEGLKMRKCDHWE